MIMVLGASNSKRGDIPTWVNYLSHKTLNLAERGMTVEQMIGVWLKHKHLEPELVILDIPPLWRYHIGSLPIGGVGSDEEYTDWMKKNKLYAYYKRKYHDRENFDVVVNSLYKGRDEMINQQKIMVKALKELIPNWIMLPELTPQLDEVHYTDAQHKELARMMDNDISSRHIDNWSA